jgi:hypothetical protein
MSWDSLVGVRGFNHGRGKIFLFSTTSRPALGPTQLPIQGVSQAPAGEKRQQREAGHSPSSSAEVKNDRAIPPLAHMSSLLSA